MLRVTHERAESERQRVQHVRQEPFAAYHYFDVVRLRLTRSLSKSELKFLRQNAKGVRLKPVITSVASSWTC
jgi:hypothetical protein